MARPFERGLLGGTFDQFHQGHQKLIMSGLEKCNILEIWVTSDEIASQKIKVLSSGCVSQLGLALFILFDCLFWN